MPGGHHSALAPHSGTLDDMFQFPDVAGPWVGIKKSQHILFQAGNGVAILLIDFFEKKAAKGWNILQPLSQGWNVQLHYIDTVIQIFPETPFLNHFFQVLICTADDSHVDLHRFDTPHPFNLLLLQNAEQLGLEVQGHLADLVQQEGTVIGQLKFADFATLGRT